MNRLVLIATLVMSLIVNAEMNDSILAFSTPGPDRYADGTRVLNGESYALVWQKAGTEFAGFTADCHAVDEESTKILAVASLAKGGKCPETIFEIDADFAAELANGTFALYLLDTRTSATTLAYYKNGRPSVINAIGTSEGGAINLAKVGLESKIDDPVIVRMAIKDAKIVLTVDGMSEAANYYVVPMQSLGESEVKPSYETQRLGNTLTIDADKGSFFKIIGTRKF